ncbi:MAG: hypothetical protein RLY23_1731, partial [Actinomycetota bacterium]
SSTTTPSATSADAGHHRGGQLNLTDEQKTCLTEAGITKPEGRPTQAEREAFKAAAETCGITLPTRPDHAGRELNLTDEQKTCLTEAGITKPEGRPTQAERDAFKAAAETCGITLPARPENAGGRLNLTDTQKTCLTEAGITKPEGRPTQAERDAFKAAAETCGITLPARPSAEPGLGAPDEAPGMGGRFGDGHGPGGRFGRGFDGPGPSGSSGSTGSTGTDGAPVEPTSGS